MVSQRERDRKVICVRALDARRLVGLVVAIFVLGPALLWTLDARESVAGTAGEAGTARVVGSGRGAKVAKQARGSALLARPPKGLDRGIWPELASKVSLKEPPWLARASGALVVRHGARRFVMVDHTIIGFAGKDTRGWPEVAVSDLRGRDQDGDGIPDALDILIGAKKAAANAAPYGSPYRRLKYPGGDVPREEGVCTDVVIRALRNAGIDLQKTLYEDIKRRPKAFPMVRKRNRNIDHRRVKTLLPHFKKHWDAQPTDPRAGDALWLPGDVIFMQTMGDSRPDHVGIITDQRGPSGLPLVINNWTDGYHTSAMDVLPLVPVTHRFRVRRARLRVAQSARGVEGVLRRRGVMIPPQHRQAVVSVVAHSDVWRARLQRAARSEGGAWRAVGASWRGEVGSAGIGVGRGLVATALPRVTPKREGDRRAPAGVFALGAAFGPGKRAPCKARWRWRRTTARDVWVDDPRSPQYNSWQRRGAGSWRSAEALRSYRLGVIVQHNMSPVKPGAGSAIFLHVTSRAKRRDLPTTGCTSMPRAALCRVVGWLDPAQRPVLVQVPGQVL